MKSCQEGTNHALLVSALALNLALNQSLMTALSCFHLENPNRRLLSLQLATQQRALNHGNEGFKWPSAGLSSTIE
jgi:hypothetical protein